MSWMNQLYKTYENNVGRTQSEKNEFILAPLAHMNANIQVEITLDCEGDFLDANEIPKEEGETLIPVTESSASRSSGAAPHPLSDNLSYIAADYADYAEGMKQKKTAKKRYEIYLNSLKQWVESQYSHPKLEAIYKYIVRGKVIWDLVQKEIVHLNEDGTLTQDKISGQPYEKVMVRFRVIIPGDKESDATWQDVSLQQAYTNYYMTSMEGRKDFCYLLGEYKTVAQSHPKGIVAASYGAKIISANDSQGFSFLGRFCNAEEAYALSYEATQKIHSALSWLVKKQGVYVGKKDKRTYVCWNPGGKKIVNIWEEMGFEDDTHKENDTEPEYRKKLIDTFRGYAKEFTDADDIIVMGLEAATTGRLSITYYNELKASDFLKRIQKWFETCCWYFMRFTPEKKPINKIETPKFTRIVECAYGTEQGSFLEANDKVMKEQTQRLVHCMLDEKPIPFDLVHALTCKASSPLAYARGNRQRILSVACALIAKYYNDKGGSIEMKLDKKNQDRSYLFGRLLAVLEMAERSTYDYSENREPNAIRLQSAYVNHPMQTWKTLEEALKPYFQKLRPGYRKYYKDLIGEILLTMPETDEMKLNKALDSSYLLGYYLQREELYTKKEKREEEEYEYITE